MAKQEAQLPSLHKTRRRLVRFVSALRSRNALQDQMLQTVHFRGEAVKTRGVLGLPLVQLVARQDHAESTP